jgi:hypothetical protein
MLAPLYRFLSERERPIPTVVVQNSLIGIVPVDESGKHVLYFEAREDGLVMYAPISGAVPDSVDPVAVIKMLSVRMPIPPEYTNAYYEQGAKGEIGIAVEMAMPRTFARGSVEDAMDLALELWEKSTQVFGGA